MPMKASSRSTPPGRSTRRSRAASTIRASSPTARRDPALRLDAANGGEIVVSGGGSAASLRLFAAALEAAKGDRRALAHPRRPRGRGGEVPRARRQGARECERRARAARFPFAPARRRCLGEPGRIQHRHRHPGDRRARRARALRGGRREGAAHARRASRGARPRRRGHARPSSRPRRCIGGHRRGHVPAAAGLGRDHHARRRGRGGEEDRGRRRARLRRSPSPGRGCTRRSRRSRARAKPSRSGGATTMWSRPRRRSTGSWR